jgi:hypothetical protein
MAETQLLQPPAFIHAEIIVKNIDDQHLQVRCISPYLLSYYQSTILLAGAAQVESRYMRGG